MFNKSDIPYKKKKRIKTIIITVLCIVLGGMYLTFVGRNLVSTGKTVSTNLKNDYDNKKENFFQTVDKTDSIGESLEKGWGNFKYLKDAVVEGTSKAIDYYRDGYYTIKENNAQPKPDLDAGINKSDTDGNYGEHADGLSSNKDTTIQTSSQSLRIVSITKVVDGDTVWVYDESTDDSYKVRLIGINTEESVADETYKENTENGRLASDYVKNYLEKEFDCYNNYVYLELDQEEFDQYDRTLAYIWLTYPVNESKNNIDYIRENMLNARIMDSGYAQVMTIEPNTKYKEVFTYLYNDASQNNRGLYGVN